MAPNTHLEVIRIPCDGSTMSLTKLPLINIGPGGLDADECNVFEIRLLHIPDVKSLDSLKSFNWAYRTLVGFTKKDVRQATLNGDYMMYLCVDERSGLPHNDYLEKLVELGRGPNIPSTRFKVYGDAFVFRMESESKGYDEGRRARYVHMDDGFVDSAMSRGTVATWAFCLLRRLLLSPDKVAKARKSS